MGIINDKLCALNVITIVLLVLVKMLALGVKKGFLSKKVFVVTIAALEISE